MKQAFARPPFKALAALALAVALAAPTPGASAGTGLKAVVFDLEPVEIPLTTAMKARLADKTALIRKLMTDAGLTVVDTTPQVAAIAKNLPLSQCNGCDQDIAKALGADIEVTSAVQAASSVIFNLSGSVKDVATNRVLREGVVDIRGPDDAVWNHGVKFLVRERLLTPPLPKDEAGLKALVASAPKAAE